MLELKLMMSQDNVMQLIALNGVVTMDEKAFIQDRIEALEESIAFLLRQPEAPLLQARAIA